MIRQCRPVTGLLLEPAHLGLLALPVVVNWRIGIVCYGRQIYLGDIQVLEGVMAMETNYMYLLECADGSLYCGWTNHLEERVRAHNEGRGAKYTKSRRPVTLVYYEEFATKQEAMQREWAVKHLDRRKKRELIERDSLSPSDAGGK